MRYFLAFLGLIAIIVLMIVLIVNHGPGTTTGTTSGKQVIHASDYIDKNSEVSLTTDGQINASEFHRTIKITITANSRNLTVFKGYEGAVLKQQNYPNDKSAYDSFMHSLDKAGFTKEKTGVTQVDERGVCPTGSRFIYQLRNDDKDLLRLWSVSCTNTQGTFAGVGSTVRSLFQKQIPDYSKQLQGVAL